MRLMKGHTDMVVCCAESRHDPFTVATGSEDSSVRLWDLRTLKSTRRLTCPDPVAAVSEGIHGQEWLIASGNRLIRFDLRMTDKVLVNEHSTLYEASDDIGDLDVNLCSSSLDDATSELREQLAGLSISSGAKNDSRIALADDLGFVSVLDGSDQVVSRLQCTSKTIVSAVRFVSSDLCISGGFDNALVFSSSVKGSILARFPITPSLASVNPPHVHSIDVSRRLHSESGLVACAVGDGSLVVADTSPARRKNGGYNWGKLGESLNRMENVHSAATSCVRFINLEMIASCGNDKTMAVTKRTSTGKLSVQHRIGLRDKPNALCFPQALTGQVIVCDVGNDVQVVRYEG